MCLKCQLRPALGGKWKQKTICRACNDYFVRHKRFERRSFRLVGHDEFLRDLRRSGLSLAEMAERMSMRLRTRISRGSVQNWWEKYGRDLVR